MVDRKWSMIIRARGIPGVYQAANHAQGLFRSPDFSTP